MRNPPEPGLFQDVALELGVDPAFVEKDWFAVQLIAHIAEFNSQHDAVQAVFSGGTSLSKGYGLIKRFSEDLDFFVTWPTAPEPSVGQRRTFRRKLLDDLKTASGFKIDDDQLLRGDSHRFFKTPIIYTRVFEQSALRPHLQLEMSFMQPQIAPETRPLRSLVATALAQDPETAIPCISPLETAADKLSALCWRVLARNRNDTMDDPTIIRHLHDLAALSVFIDADLPTFLAAARTSLARDKARRRGGDNIAMLSDTARLEQAAEKLRTDRAYPLEYGNFVMAMSYADASDMLGFEAALTLFENLVNHYLARC
ncbi:MAG: nucleotidyl transferase AbiEii/AbiGii toxin family protein [Candidatus Competibacteraceae bacterium]|nr:nucleotidyl transferase AbiEii/AbiGii toxin family protein [Candidatus Competibacteraceae bacterium]